VPVARTHSIALVGVEGYPVEIESDIENGLPCLFLVGLPDTALREARDRIRAAIINSREQWPQRRITVGLSPASLPKRGSGFDLGIALSILAAAGTIPAAAIDGVAFLGELGLDGRLRPVRGVLPAVVAAAGAGFREVVVAQANVGEAALVPGLRVIGAPSLTAMLAWLRAERESDEAAAVYVSDEDAPSERPRSPDIEQAASGSRRGSALPGWQRPPILVPTYPRYSASRSPAGRPRSALRVATIFHCSVRPVLARRCWPSGFLPSCQRWAVKRH